MKGKMRVKLTGDIIQTAHRTHQQFFVQAVKVIHRWSNTGAQPGAVRCLLFGQIRHNMTL